MTQSNYRNKINKIFIPEAVSSLVAFAGIIYIAANFQKLQTWYLLVCGIVAVLILFLLPYLSLKSIRTMRRVNISGSNYKDALMEYSKSRLRFVFVQKLSFYLGAVLMLVILPVMGAVMGGKDLFKTTPLWYSYAIAFPFFYAFAQWVFKHYIKIAADAENILKDIEG
jgi:hypothetical protein